MLLFRALWKHFVHVLTPTPHFLPGMLILLFLSACQSEYQAVFNDAKENPARLSVKAPEVLISGESGAVTGSVTGAINSAVKSVSGPINLRKRVNPGETSFYHALVAEIYLQQGQSSLAADEYLLASKASRDKFLLKKATVLAATTGKNQQALVVAKRWAKLETGSLEAKQYQALLLLRTDHYADSARVLYAIKRFVAGEANDPVEAAHFISKLMSLETHHSQAYKAYRVYLNKYGDIETDKNADKLVTYKNNPSFDLRVHQQITLAGLAMKSKRYKVVLRILDKINTEQAVLLRSKAFKSLGQADQAVSILRSWLDKKNTGDGLRFEYVRYSILSGEKAEATRVLQKLVKKHPGNKDLLKSLVALYLDQKKWDLAEVSAKKLLAFKDYRSDASLFMGEIFEARGKYRQALQAYEKVVDGNLVKNALKRIPLLIEKQQGISAARLWLHKQRHLAQQKPQGKSLTVLQKADFYKIEGDLLFANKRYGSALEYYQRALALAPNNSAFRLARALTYEQQGRIELAESELKQVLKQDKHDPAALNALGYLLVEHTERFDEAMQLIKKAQKISPDDAAINDSLGWLHYRRGDIASAEHYLRKSFEAMKQPDVASHLIEVLQKRGQKHEAENILYQMLRQYPDDQKLKDISIN